MSAPDAGAAPPAEAGGGVDLDISGGRLRLDDGTATERQRRQNQQSGQQRRH